MLLLPVHFMCVRNCEIKSFDSLITIASARKTARGRKRDNERKRRTHTDRYTQNESAVDKAGRFQILTLAVQPQ